MPVQGNALRFVDKSIDSHTVAGCIFGECRWQRAAGQFPAQEYIIRISPVFSFSVLLSLEKRVVHGIERCHMQGESMSRQKLLRDKLLEQVLSGHAFLAEGYSLFGCGILLLAVGLQGFFQLAQGVIIAGPACVGLVHGLSGLFCQSFWTLVLEDTVATQKAYAVQQR